MVSGQELVNYMAVSTGFLLGSLLKDVKKGSLRYYVIWVSVLFFIIAIISIILINSYIISSF